MKRIAIIALIMVAGVVLTAQDHHHPRVQELRSRRSVMQHQRENTGIPSLR